jgi:putative hydrolase of the HAD superfamily
MLKLILFDVGDVLINYLDAFKTASKEQNIPYEHFDTEWFEIEEAITLGDISVQDFYRLTVKKYKDNADLNYDFLDSWIRDFNIIKPTYDLIKEIKDDYKIGILSDIYKDMVPELIERDILPKIDYAYQFLSCDLGMRKPQRELYEYIVKTVDVKPEEIFFTDDKQENLEIPNEMGWATYHFDKHDPEKSVEEIKKIIM